MLKTILGMCCLSFTIPAFAEANTSDYQQFVPDNWKIIKTVKGDLNQDHLDDVVLVIEDNDPQNIITNAGLGSSTLNTNPRTMLILFKTAQGYKLAGKNSQFPSENDANSPCLADPLEDGAINISNKGILKLGLNYWLSCGSWYVTNNTFSFRYQNGTFKLIGFDQFSFHRASGEETLLSINFSTGKMKETTGKNEFGKTGQAEKISWQKLQKHYDLEFNQINFNEPPEFQ